MKSAELKALINEGALKKYDSLYPDLQKQSERIIAAVDCFSKRFGEEREVCVFSAPGRTEIIGNHTDHNLGKCIAGAVDRDIIAIAAKNDDGKIRVLSEGFSEELVDLSKEILPESFKKSTSSALIGGIVKGFTERSYDVGGFDAYLTSSLPIGSGLSSSAAYEVLICTVLNHLYNEGRVGAVEVAKISQYSENEFFGKPSGLLDQLASSVGGFVYMDFEDKSNPKIEEINFSLSDAGYALCIVNTGGSHANLDAVYASVPSEMKQIAKLLGRDTLRGLSEDDLIKNAVNLRRIAGDRALLRSIHFVRENERVDKLKDALKDKNITEFLKNINGSGRSSFEYLQNVYNPETPREQGIALALALADGYFEGKAAAYRVHGGGFAGTAQIFLPVTEVRSFSEYMDSLFGVGATTVLNMRPAGGITLF